MARTVFKTAEAGATRPVGSIPTLSRHFAHRPYVMRLCVVKKRTLSREDCGRKEQRIEGGDFNRSLNNRVEAVARAALSIQRHRHG